MATLVVERNMSAESFEFKPFPASVNVAQLLKAEVGARRSYDLSELAEGSDRVRGRVDLLRSLDGILVTAEFETELEAECARCLMPARVTVVARFEEEFLPSIDVVSGLPVSVSGPDGAFMIDQNHILDLGEAIRQYALLAAPMKPLCKPDCAGLCPKCGQDLNRGACGCRAPAVDPRWEKLARLKPRQG
jgi:uncharacterized protein